MDDLIKEITSQDMGYPQVWRALYNLILTTQAQVDINIVFNNRGITLVRGK